MQVDLSPEQNSFIDLGIQQGRFRSREEAVQQALAQWEKRERARVELLASLDLADCSLDAGEGEGFSAESINGLAASVARRGSARLGQQECESD